jgi:malate dehydrogenase (oxaloacetate-decarboxylating)
MGLGILASSARRVTDGMFDAGARALGALSPAARDPRATLLPPVGELRTTAVEIATAVANAAVAEGVAPAASEDDLRARVVASQWIPQYEG